MTNPGSVTLLAQQLRSSDAAVRNEAAQQIWRHHLPRLLDLACRSLDPRVRRREDEDDIVQSMYASFCNRMKRGEFAVESRADLLRLLVTMTLNKTRGAAVRQGGQCRDFRREVGGGGEEASGLEAALAHMEDVAPTPDEAVAMTEELERRLAMLPEPLRQIALWKLEGYTHEEIAAPDRLNCTERTVERRLHQIRQIWDPSA